jgi:T-complex protein 1 subunit epsilon
MCTSPCWRSSRASESLHDRGIHPIRIADGFDRACMIAVKNLESIADTIEYSKTHTESLLKTAMTTLGSKMFALKPCLRRLTNACCVAFRRNMNNSPKLPSTQCCKSRTWNAKMFCSTSSKLTAKSAGPLQIRSSSRACSSTRICHTHRCRARWKMRASPLTCPFETPRPKTKHKLDISRVEASKL